MTLRLVPDDTCRGLVARCAPMGHAEFCDKDRGFRVVTERGRTAAAIVFSDYRPHFASVELSAIGLECCASSPQIVVQLGWYVFGQLRINRVWARTSTKNDRAQRLLKHIGFTREATHADFYGRGLHAEVWRMLRREWERKYGAMREAA